MIITHAYLNSFFKMNMMLFYSTDRHVEKESLAEYIAKKREMFLVQVIVFV